MLRNTGDERAHMAQTKMKRDDNGQTLEILQWQT